MTVTWAVPLMRLKKLADGLHPYSAQIAVAKNPINMGSDAQRGRGPW